MVHRALIELDSGKGAVPDFADPGFPPDFWKKTASAMAASLTQIYSASLLSGVFPLLWRLAYVIAVHKSELRSKVQNHRQI